MMRPSTELTDVYLCLQPVDFRKGINTLSQLVAAELGEDPFSSRLFVFHMLHRLRTFNCRI
ncbi:MAG: IS66 family insertion sequence element accessory protein TnpB [Magnetococcales bacterium]|nr:IS66 family insertion sequence element accessory protein TnpB [Magnetococcales bacterium]